MASGYLALSSNTTGSFNTADGAHALQSSTTGNNNTANGSLALFNNIRGQENNIGGHDNIAVGFQALKGNTTGVNNVALGSNAGSNLTTGSNDIDIGSPGVAGEANKIRIGKQGTQNGTFIAGISGVAVSGSPVLVSTTGKLGIMSSSARFKEAIKPMDKASEAILALQPVTFLYKHELDPDGVLQFGLVAEQVEKVNPDLVVRDEEGKVNTVRYEAVNAMLLNEFLKEHRKVEEQGATIAQMKKQIDALTATVQTVSEQIEMNEPARHLVINP